MTVDYEFLDHFCDLILHQGHSVRWCAVVNSNGVILSQRTRSGLVLMLTDEENEEYAATAIARQRTRSKFEAKIGRLSYALGRYEKLTRVTIPVNENFFVLASFDVESKDFDDIIIGHLLPLIAENRNMFVTMHDSI